VQFCIYRNINYAQAHVTTNVDSWLIKILSKLKLFIFVPVFSITGPHQVTARN